MWQERDGKLYREFQFKDFKQAFSFMAKVAHVADRMNHHPTWTNTYNKVEIWLNTHSADDSVTDKDRTLAKEIDRIYEDFKV
ncbi:MAG: 4a-hydroxytetrahydrobiopterin dehydratase [Candidatus Saccharimonadales bacterium]